MTYVPVHDPWEDGEHDADADAFNQIETGIRDAHVLAEAAQETADEALGAGSVYVRLDTAEAKGDLIAGQSFGVVGRVAVGSGNQTIFPDTTSPQGVSWQNLEASRLAGYPSDASKFLRGDGTWSAPSGGIAPTFIGNDNGSIGTMSTVANTAYLVPIHNIISASVITRIQFYGSAFGGGTYDVGVYSSDDESTFTRLVSKGATAVPSNGTPVLVTVSSTTITPVAGRRWYLAFGGSAASVIGSGGINGFAFSKAATYPLPASITSMTQNTAGIAMPYLSAAV